MKLKITIEGEEKTNHESLKSEPNEGTNKNE